MNVSSIVWASEMIILEFSTEYSVILQRFHLYSTYKGFYFNVERSTFISSKEWRNTYEPTCYRKFIALKREQKNLTQEQLAEKLGVSNKTISKWETGKCMPDYSIVKSLCEELEVTVAELMDGEVSEEKSVRTYDDEQILDLLRRTQELEKQKNMLYGIMLIVMGIALGALSHTIGGSDFKDFISGFLLGLSIGEMLAGIFVVGKSLAVR